MYRFGQGVWRGPGNIINTIRHGCGIPAKHEERGSGGGSTPKAPICFLSLSLSIPPPILSLCLFTSVHHSLLPAPYSSCLNHTYTHRMVYPWYSMIYPWLVPQLCTILFQLILRQSWKEPELVCKMESLRLSAPRHISQSLFLLITLILQTIVKCLDLCTSKGEV